VKSQIMLAALLIMMVAAMSGLAQSNQAMDRILEEERLSCGAASYLVLTASGGIGEDASFADAAGTLAGQSWWKSSKEPDDPLTLGEFSLMVMQTVGMSGGLMYSLIPGPRYAARELAFKRLIEGSTSPYRSLSGEEAVRMLGRVLEAQEAVQ
jgi:hypothetical protein